MKQYYGGTIFMGGFLFGFLFAIIIFTVVISHEPSAIDVYRGRTTLEITSKNGVPIDTIVVFKDEFK